MGGGDGVGLFQGEGGLGVLAARLAVGAGASTKETRFHLEPLTRQFELDRFHYALIGAGLAVLLVACTNLTNLQLARGLGRRSELALRSSLGPSRRQIITQLTIEPPLIAGAPLLPPAL